jgi:hypothetical protein
MRLLMAGLFTDGYSTELIALLQAAYYVPAITVATDIFQEYSKLRQNQWMGGITRNFETYLILGGRRNERARSRELLFDFEVIDQMNPLHGIQECVFQNDLASHHQAKETKEQSMPSMSQSPAPFFIGRSIAGTRRRLPRMLTSGRVVHPGWLTAGPVSATEAGDAVQMKVGVHIKTNRSSHCLSCHWLCGRDG